MSSILQGTTPSLKIRPKDDVIQVAAATEIELTIRNGERQTIKHLADVAVDAEENSITYHFTEAETFALAASDSLTWQLRFLIGGEVVGTTRQKIDVAELMSREHLK